VLFCESLQKLQQQRENEGVRMIFFEVFEIKEINDFTSFSLPFLIYFVRYFSLDLFPEEFTQNNCRLLFFWVNFFFRWQIFFYPALPFRFLFLLAMLTVIFYFFQIFEILLAHFFTNTKKNNFSFNFMKTWTQSKFSLFIHFLLKYSIFIFI